MTQQTLREEIIKELYNKNPYRYRHIEGDDGLNDVRQALISLEKEMQIFMDSQIKEIRGHSISPSTQSLLARFKEFAEKELIGEDEREFFPSNQYEEDIAYARNALRNEQREKLSDAFFK